jgi:hypothetical protein
VILDETSSPSRNTFENHPSDADALSFAMRGLTGWPAKRSGSSVVATTICRAWFSANRQPGGMGCAPERYGVAAG